MRWLSLTTGLFALIAVQSQPAFSDAKRLMAFAEPGVVFVHHRNALNEHCYGTGIVVTGKGYIVTCYHVVEPAAQRNDKDNGVKVEDKIWVRVKGWPGPVETKLIHYWAALDVALLHIQDDTPEYLCLADDHVLPGEEIYVVGYPTGKSLGQEMAITQGIVSASRESERVLQIDAATNPGNSGGPVLEGSGKVVGVAWAKLEGYDALNFAVSARAVRAALAAWVQLPDADARGPAASNPVFAAIREGNYALVEKILRIAPKLANQKAEQNFTPLMLAAGWGRSDLMRLLVSSGADVSARHLDGDTALFHAVDNLECLSYLVSQGADPRMRGYQGDSLLHRAASSGTPDVLEYLIGLGVDAKSRNDYQGTPLHSAVSGGALYNNSTVANASLLLRKGTEVNARNSDGHTALQLACMLSEDTAPRLALAKLLIANGADVNAPDKSGKTPLHWAAEFNTSDVAAELIASGADLTASDKSGKTPLQLAVAQGNSAVAQLLRQHGAK